MISIVRIPFVSAVALVKDSGPFISTTELLCVVADLFPAALFASLCNDAGRLHVCVGNGLHFGPLRAQSRRKCCGLGMCHNRLGRSIFARCAAYSARQNGVLFASTAVQQIAAVSAEDKGSDGRHDSGKLSS